MARCNRLHRLVLHLKEPYNLPSSAFPRAASKPFQMANSYVLGISAFYHDSAACLLQNGDLSIDLA
jgi:hypothetical protein